MLLRTNTSSRLNIIISRRRTIIIYHRRAMMGPASFRRWMTVSHLLRWVSRRSVTLYTNKWSGSNRRPRGLTNYASTSSNNKPTSSIYSVRWDLLITHHHHHLSDLACYPLFYFRFFLFLHTDQ
jgi:hypothetical protein